MASDLLDHACHVTARDSRDQDHLVVRLHGGIEHEIATGSVRLWPRRQPRPGHDRRVNHVAREQEGAVVAVVHAQS